MSSLFIWLEEHSLLILLSVAAVFTFIWLFLMRGRLKIKWYTALLLSLLHVGYGVLCVRVFARLEGAGSGAMSLFGAVFFMPAAYYIGAKLFKRPLADVFDIFAVVMIFTLLCARCNCIIAGCCLGRFIPGTALRWPTREVEIIFYIIFLALIVPRVWKDQTKGLVYPLYMTTYGVFRTVVECFRVSESNTLFHISLIWALLAFALGISIYIEIKNKRIRKRG